MARERYPIEYEEGDVEAHRAFLETQRYDAGLYPGDVLLLDYMIQELVAKLADASIEELEEMDQVYGDGVLGDLRGVAPDDIGIGDWVYVARELEKRLKWLALRVKKDTGYAIMSLNSVRLLEELEREMDEGKR